ncbi:hypothetical protein [Actinocrispum sp. NPDC049592]|uniref:hypothetical protein n=1 Tax=Actinocrispum sp. NPDC049592 TaxID=3154835 RepID=UPI0034174CFC
MAALEDMTPFQAALAAGRDRYNARFRLAKHRSRQLDANAFLDHLRQDVGPAVNAAAAQGGDPVAVTEALVDLAFATHGRPPAGLAQLLPALARFVAAEPRRVAVTMANALHHLESGGDAPSWIAAMTAVAPMVESTEELLDAGGVAAWRHGLAVLRASALDTARRLRPEVLTVLLGASEVDSSDPWRAPGEAGTPRLRVVRRVGQFRGFGGTFARPPLVFTSGGRWHASDGHETWRIHVDRFGTSLNRVAQVPPDASSSGLSLSRDGTVQFGQSSLEVPELAGATSWATLDNTLAATTPWTHAITFVAWTP